MGGGRRGGGKGWGDESVKVEEWGSIRSQGQSSSMEGGDERNGWRLCEVRVRLAGGGIG